MKIGRPSSMAPIGPASMARAVDDRERSGMDDRLTRLREMVQSADAGSYVIHAKGGVKKRVIDLIYWELIVKELGIQSQ